jgi:hypothetical protein
MTSVQKVFKPVWIAGVFALLAFGCSGLQHSSSTSPRDRLADAYGIKDFNQVEELRYTFNVKVGDKVTSRSWSWEPKTDRVTFKGTAEQGGTVSYERSVLTGQPTEQVKKVDPQFVNDNYWLIFPLRLYWDRSATVTADDAPASLPIGTGKARRIVVSYPTTEGYTPGDVYELFVDDSDRIVQWVYRKGGDPKPTRITTWEDYRKVGPLKPSLNHQGPDASFRVWFTDVAVRLVGKTDWDPARY